jgi:hypothetical protein
MQRSGQAAKTEPPNSNDGSCFDEVHSMSALAERSRSRSWQVDSGQSRASGGHGVSVRLESSDRC